MDINTIIASRIKTIRLTKNKSQKDIANEIGLSETAYSRLENGITQLSITVLYAICEKLSCKIEEILDIEIKKVANNNNSVVLSQYNEGTFHVSVSTNDFLEMIKLLEEKKNKQTNS
jgi:transcriptional regulator with XRE-family HTH domain